MINDQLTIQVNDLSKRYNREWIFKNLNHTFQSGKTYAITGPNGSGKSTLMQVLWGQMPQSSGTISYSLSGKNIPVEEIFSQVVVAAPYMDLIEELTLTEHLTFHFKLRKPRPGYSIESILEKLYMTDSRDKQIGNFSSGMKQRVKLGLAFFTDAQMIFLDEPGTNLDEQAFGWYSENLKNLTQENVLTFIASNQKNEYPADAEVISLVRHK
jgi:ABC-type multidrug transport system ATPase subunit